MHGSRFCLVERQILIGKRLYGLKILREEKGISLYPALDDLRSLFAGDVERLFGLVILQNRKLTVSQRRELLLSRRVGVNNGLSGPGTEESPSEDGPPTWPPDKRPEPGVQKKDTAPETTAENHRLLSFSYSLLTPFSMKSKTFFLFPLNWRPQEDPAAVPVSV